MDIDDRAECLNAGLAFLDDRANREALIRNALREAANAGCEKIISEVEVAAAAARGTEIYRLARDLRFRFDRATADD